MKTWHHSQHVALEKKIYRTVILARTNEDYRIRYPQEAKDCKNTTFKQPHKEAIKRVEHEHNLWCKLHVTPAVDRPKRLNRNE